VTERPQDLRHWRLPRGRHGLPREIVERSQRERLLAAIVRVTTARGYQATTVADVLEEAGVGRETFYELYADKRECMLAAHSILIDDLEGKVRAAYAMPGDWPDRIREALAATLEWFAADPEVSRFTLIELAAVGPVSRERFRSVFGRFVELLDDGIDEDGPRPELSRASGLAVGAALARIYEEVVRGRAAELPCLLPELTFELLVPYVGEEVAEEQRRAAASSAPAQRAGR
jgi:AcrR family transcriptional regulator